MINERTTQAESRNTNLGVVYMIIGFRVIYDVQHEINICHSLNIPASLIALSPSRPCYSHRIDNDEIGGVGH